MAVPVSNSVAEVGNPRIDGLVQGSSWTFGSGSRTITYSLNIAFDTDRAPGTWTTSWKNAVANAFDAWEAVANVDFDRVGGVGTQLQNKSAANIAIALERLGDVPFAGLGIFPSPAFADKALSAAGYSRTSGDFPYPRPEGDIVFVHDSPAFASLAPGYGGFKVMLHEIGHALGLKHPSDGGAGSRPTFKELGIGSLDDLKHTVMTAKGFANGVAGNDFPATPMPLDILAIQRIYGANMSYRTGDDVYKLRSDPLLTTIWDAGGHDTFDASAVGAADSTYVLDLNGGSFSGFKGARNTAIAYNVIIENAIGGQANDLIFGNTANNNLSGGTGSDTINGGDGNDTLNGGTGSNVLNGGNGDDTITGLDDDTINGGKGNDNISLGEGTAHGGSGADTITSAVNADVFGDDGGDTISIFRGTARGGGGADTITVFGDYGGVLYGDAGNDTLTGSDGGSDLLNGGAGNDTLDGRAGTDELHGGDGNDTYFIAGFAPLDSIFESANAGNDTVQTPLSYVLPSNVENLTLTGTDDVNGTGNALDNVLTGNSGINTLTGGLGNDTYVIQNAEDVVVENADEGIDSLVTPFTTSLEGTNLENLTLTGDDDIDGIGTSTDNVLTGNSGGNTLTGGLGNDTYVIQNESDVIVENEDEGIDTVVASISYSLADTQLENLTLAGSEALTATGNQFDNVLTGNAAASTLTGGLGDDTYIVRHSTQIIVESFDEGVDGVQSSVTYTLGANVENITLTGGGDINATGNSLDNTLTGNSGDNLLNGKAGADNVSGGSGSDTLVWSASDLLLNGGSGTDILKVNGSGVHVNLTTLPNGTVVNVERIDLTGSGRNTLTLNAQEVLDLSSTSNTLRVSGNAGDTVHRGGGWTTGGDQMVAGNSYHSYTKGLATLLVDSDIAGVV